MSQCSRCKDQNNAGVKSYCIVCKTGYTLKDAIHEGEEAQCIREFILLHAHLHYEIKRL